MQNDGSLHQLEVRLADHTAELLEVLEAELNSLRRQRDRLNQTITSLTRKRLFYAARSDGSKAVLAGSVNRFSKPVAVREVLQDVSPRALRLREIHAELVRRGWSLETAQDKHALEVAVRAMEHRGELQRPERGYYRLRVAPQAKSHAA